MSGLRRNRELLHFDRCQGVTDWVEMHHRIEAAKRDPEIAWYRGKPARNAGN